MPMLDLDLGYRLYQTAQDMANARIIGRMYGQYNRRGPFFYPRGPNMGNLGVQSLADAQTEYQKALDEINRMRAQFGVAPTEAGTDVARSYGYVSVWDPPLTPEQLMAQTARAKAVADALLLQSQPGILPGGGQMTTAAASQLTNKPNASVPPQNELTPMGTGLPNTAGGLNDQFGGGNGQGTGEKDNTLLFVALAIGALFLMKGKQ